ncbi:hypothetical protein MKW92_029304 [Papaver armeniacum]|nr:hypothetical protein MKW92_029304 [Papaver armeniacum]
MGSSKCNIRILLLLLVVYICSAMFPFIHGTTSSSVSHEDYPQIHGKHYATASIVREKFSNFVENVELIKSTNSRKLTYTLAVNEFADLSWEELKTKRMRGSPRIFNTESSTQSFNVQARASLPMKKDWRDDGIVTPVKEQGDCSSCWAFSATGALEAAYAKAFRKQISLSEQQLVDCSAAYGNDGCEGGLPSQAFEYVRLNGGLESRKTYPYTEKQGACRNSSAEAKVKVMGVNITQGEESLKHAVGHVGPVSVLIDAIDSFTFYEKGIFASDQCGNTFVDMNHAVLAVGYGIENGTKYWIIKNSWGTDWGERGYGRVEMGTNMCGIATFGSYPIIDSSFKSSAPKNDARSLLLLILLSYFLWM